jgi:carbon monoxide dehydrogenase subunit G
MDLTNEFTVGLPIDRAWALLTDIERIAPCMPGAQLTGVEGDTYSGLVKIKLGPVTAQYAGTAVFERKDDDAHIGVLRASGRDSHGQGNASALITATLVAEGDHTKVSVHTDLTITGKVAQFGRGVILDVSAKLLTQFVQCLESSLGSEATGPAAAEPAAPPVAEPAAESPQPQTPKPETPKPETPTPRVEPARVEPAPRFTPQAEVAPLDLGSVAGGAILKRAIPAAVVVAVVVAVIVWLANR